LILTPVYEVSRLAVFSDNSFSWVGGVFSSTAMPVRTSSIVRASATVEPQGVEFEYSEHPEIAVRTISRPTRGKIAAVMTANDRVQRREPKGEARR
jgi:hypothetical protein